jgi:hypothetical protein
MKNNDNACLSPFIYDLLFSILSIVFNDNLLLDVDIYHEILTSNVCEFIKLSHNKKDYV